MLGSSSQGVGGEAGREDGLVDQVPAHLYGSQHAVAHKERGTQLRTQRSGRKRRRKVGQVRLAQIPMFCRPSYRNIPFSLFLLLL